jgi:cytochrome b subunit of formate dehydrogenase
MADRSGLKLVGFVFATVTLVVMLVTGMVVKGYADGAYSLDGASVASRAVIIR